MNSKTKLPPIYFSIIGFAVLLAWVLIAYLALHTTNRLTDSTTFQNILTTLFKNLVYWKPFTISFFMLGIGLHFKLHNHIKKANIGTTSTLISIGVLLLIMVIYALVSGNTISDQPFIFNEINAIGSSFILPALYAIILILMGLWAGTNNWLFEYHFHYTELKNIFNYSIALFVLWLLMKMFKVYALISTGVIGTVIYMIDALTLNLVIVFIYSFLLIYLENSRFGKKILSYLAYIGKYWFISAFLLLLTLFIL